MRIEKLREASGGIERASGGALCRCPTRARKRFKHVKRSHSPDHVMEICRNFHALLWQIFSEASRTERDARVLNAHVLDASVPPAALLITDPAVLDLPGKPRKKTCLKVC